MNFLGAAQAGIGAVLNPAAYLTDAVINKASGGKIGFDPTPGFSAQNVATTQAHNLFSGSPSVNVPAQKPTLQTVNNDGTTTGDSGGGSYAGDSGTSASQAASDAAQKAAALFGIDTQLQSANDGLGRLDGQYNTGVSNLNNDFNAQNNQLATQHDKALAGYSQQQVDNTNQFIAKKNVNDQTAANFLMGAQRTLGAQGAGGGSAARYALPFEAQQQAATSNATDQSVAGANLRAILGAQQDANDQYQNAQNDLSTQKESGIRDYQSKIASTRANLLSQIQGLQGQKEIANGGNFAQAQAAAAPYSSQITNLLNQIDGLAAAPALHARQVTLQQPNLGQFNWTHPAAQPIATQDPTLAGNNVPAPVIPYDPNQQKQNSVFSLFGLNQDQQQPAFA